MAVAMEHHYREDRRGPGWGRPGPSHQDMGFFASAPQSQQQPYHHASLPPTGPRSHKRRKKHGHASSSGQGFQGNVHGGRRHYGKQRFMGPRGPANRRSWDWGQGFGSPRQFSHPRDMPPWSTGNMETPRSVWHAPAAPYNSNEDLARVHGAQTPVSVVASHHLITPSPRHAFAKSQEGGQDLGLGVYEDDQEDLDVLRQVGLAPKNDPTDGMDMTFDDDDDQPTDHGEETQEDLQAKVKRLQKALADQLRYACDLEDQNRNLEERVYVMHESIKELQVENKQLKAALAVQGGQDEHGAAEESSPQPSPSHHSTDHERDHDGSAGDVAEHDDTARMST